MGCSSSAHLTHCELLTTSDPNILYKNQYYCDRSDPTDYNALSIQLNYFSQDHSVLKEKRSFQSKAFYPLFCDWNIYSSAQYSLQKLAEDFPKLTGLTHRERARFLTLESDLYQQLSTDGNNNSNRSRLEQQRLVGRRWSEPVHVYSSRNKPLFSSKSNKMDTRRKHDTAGSPKNEKFSIGTMNVNKPSIKVLLVFAKEDSQCQALHTAVGQLDYTCEVARTAEQAMELYKRSQHHLLIVDRRQTKSFDGDALCRWIRSTADSEFTTVAAIVRRRNQIDDYPLMKDLLKTGFNRVISETNRIEELQDELLQLECSEISNQFKLRTYRVVFSVLERSSDSIQIIDGDYLIEYVNHAYEVLTGYPSDQVLGHELSEFIQNETNEEDMWDSIREHICKGKAWKGAFYTKRNGDEDIQQNVTINPIIGQDGTVQHYVLVSTPLTPSFDYSMFRRKNSLELRRSSVVADQLAARRLSATSSLEGDAASHRRTNSLAKIHSMTIEAPITQIINLIGIIKENSQHQVSETLDQILDILRNSELYFPADLPSKSNDHMVSDFVEGLVTGPSYSHRRASGGDTMLGKVSASGMLIKQSKPTNSSSSSKNVIPPEVSKCFENYVSWDYNVLQLERISQNKPLVYLGFRIMQEFDACSVLQCSPDTLWSWLAGVESKYHSQNCYHNSTHAADVLHATAYFLRKERVKEWMEPLDEVAALIAAIIHDIDHPGYTNAFLINSRSPLALLYNDTAVLESHHAAFAFKFTVSDDNHNIFKVLSRDDFMTLRQSVIDMVLATELSKHFEHVNKFISIVTKSSNTDSPSKEASSSNIVQSSGDSASNSRTSVGLSAQSNLVHHEMRVLIKRVMIKVADVSNPARPTLLAVEWARRIAEEYFNQCDEEKSLGLPVVMPHFDRATCRFPKSQITFIDYFLTDMFDAWHEFCSISELMENLNKNYNYWRLLLDNGLMSLNELEDIATGRMKKKPTENPSDEDENPGSSAEEADGHKKNCETSKPEHVAAHENLSESAVNSNNSNNKDLEASPSTDNKHSKKLKSKKSEDAISISIRVELPEVSSAIEDGEIHQVVRGERKSLVNENHMDITVPVTSAHGTLTWQATSKVKRLSPKKHLTFKDHES